MRKSLARLAEEGDKHAQRMLDAVGYAAMLLLVVSIICLGIVATNVLMQIFS